MSKHQSEATSLTDLLRRASRQSRRSDRLTLGQLLALAGERSFGALLLVPGALLISPLSGIPGMATLMGLWVFLVALQMLLGRRHVWLPRWLLSRWAARKTVRKAVCRLLKPARWIDRWLKPRLSALTGIAGSYLIAGVCLALSLTMPFMEVVPFSATTAGLPLTLLGLALIARDGLLAAIALGLTVLPVAFLIAQVI